MEARGGTAYVPALATAAMMPRIISAIMHQRRISNSALGVLPRGLIAIRFRIPRFQSIGKRIFGARPTHVITCQEQGSTQWEAISGCVASVTRGVSLECFQGVNGAVQRCAPFAKACQFILHRSIIRCRSAADYAPRMECSVQEQINVLIPEQPQRKVMQPWRDAFAPPTASSSCRRDAFVLRV